MSLVAAGTLDRRITLEQVSRTQNGKGEPIETWSTLAEVWAEAREPTGRELFAAEQRTAQIDRVFTLRWRDDLTPDHRIRYGGQIYDIDSIVEIGRKEGLKVHARVRRVT